VFEPVLPRVVTHVAQRITPVVRAQSWVAWGRLGRVIYRGPVKG
jgi:hypothetical protein